MFCCPIDVVKPVKKEGQKRCFVFVVHPFEVESCSCKYNIDVITKDILVEIAT
jgi:hypothetical protein